MYCSKCNKETERNDLDVHCVGCDMNMHVECSTLSASTYKNMSKAAKLNWRCVSCREGTSKKRKAGTPSKIPEISGSSGEEQANTNLIVKIDL